MNNYILTNLRTSQIIQATVEHAAHFNRHFSINTKFSCNTVVFPPNDDAIDMTR